MVWTRRLLFVPLACALALACERKSEQAQQAQSGPDPATGYDPDARALREHPKYPSSVALLEPGAEPRELLRHDALGSSRRVKLSISMMHEGEARPLIILTLSWTGATTGDETLGYTWAVLAADNSMGEAPNKKRDDIANHLAAMFENLEGQATGTSAGLTRVIQTRGVQTTPSPSSQLYTFAVPLPAEAVGVGAVWTQTTHHGQPPPKDGHSPDNTPSLGKLLRRSSGQHLTQTERYTLVERQGPVLTIDYEMRLEPDEPEQVPTQTGEGRFVVALGDPLAQAGSFELVVPMVFPDSDGGASRTHESRQRIELEAL